MSANLVNSTALAESPTFREQVRAVMTEHALTLATPNPSTPAQHLAAAVVFDADSVVRPFVWACADDTELSTAGTPGEVDHIRRVVADRWDLIAAVIPNLGA